MTMSGRPLAIDIPERNIYKATPANGITFLYAPNPYNSIVAVRILSRMGSRFEPGPRAGMANMTMRMLSAGTETHSEEQIAGLLDRNGSHFKSESGKDWSSIDLLTTTKFAAEDLSVVIELLDQATYPEAKLAREREIVRMSILEDEDSRLVYTMRQFHRNYYGAHPYSWPSIGQLDTLDSIGRDDLVGFAASAFQPANMVVTVVGGGEEDEIQAQVEELLATRSPAAIRSLEDPQPAQPAIQDDHLFVENREGESAYIVIGYPGCAITDDQAIEMRLISALLGGSMDSRLFREIRDKRGLCYQVGAAYNPRLYHAPLLAYMVTSPSNREEAIRCTEAEIERLKNEPVPEEELERVKTYISGAYVMSMETNMGQAGRYGVYEMSGLGWGYANQFARKIQQVDAQRIQQVAQQLFTHRLIAITAPPA